MRISKDIKNMPWPEYGGIQNACFSVHGERLNSGGEQLILTFTANPSPSGGVMADHAQTFRMIIRPARRDFAVISPHNSRSRRATLETMLGMRWTPFASCYPDISADTEKMIVSAIGLPDGLKLHNHHMASLNAWTEEIIEERREAARAAAGELPDEAVLACPDELPPGLAQWVEDRILTNDFTVIYKRGGVRGVCARCRAHIKMPEGQKMRQGAFINCPGCGAEVRCVLAGSQLWSADYVDNVMAAQRGPDGTVWFRQWHIIRDNDARYGGGISKHMTEIARYAVRGRNTAMWVSEYKAPSFMGRCFTRPLERWARSKKQYIYDGMYSMFTGGIEEAVSGTALEYAGLSAYAETDPGARNLVKYAQDFARYPVMEFFYKSGYRRIVAEKVKGIEKTYANAVLWRRGKLAGCIRFPLRLLKVKPAASWSMSDMHRMRTAYRCGQMPDKEYQALFLSGAEADDYEALCKYAYPSKTVNYLKKQNPPGNKAVNSPVSISGLAHTYRDYIAECETLRLDLTQKAVLFPKNLNAAHIRTMEMVTYDQNKNKQKAFKAQAKKLMRYAWERDGLIIRPARSHSELTAEGNALSHCAGGYADRMAKGETAIFLVRFSAAPDTPYYTLELKGKAIIQCRTKNNAQASGDVKAFIDAWARTVVAAGGVKKVKKAAGIVI